MAPGRRMMQVGWMLAALWLCLGGASPAGAAGAEGPRVIIATYAENEAQSDWAAVLAESLREFGEGMKETPVRLYLPTAMQGLPAPLRGRLEAAAVTVLISDVPPTAMGVIGAGKCYAAALAEEQAAGECEILVWMDSDTFILRDPRPLVLREGIALGCTPVFHQRIGSLYGQPADEFWGSIYRKLEVPEAAVFPVETLIDGKTLRAYFNAGLLVVRPERGVLRAWPPALQTLLGDRYFIGACKQDLEKRNFLHQAALAAVICKHLKREEILLYPSGINYPLNLQKNIPADQRPEMLDELVTCRHEFFFREAGWADKIRASDRLMAWLKARFSR